MYPCLYPRNKRVCQFVCIGVAAEKQSLKDEHRCGPYSCGSTKPRQYVRAENQFHLEKEKRRKENSEGINQGGGSTLTCSHLGDGHFRRGTHRLIAFLMAPAAPPCASPWQTSAHVPLTRL